MLSNQQRQAIQDITREIDAGTEVIALSGPAGSGKTTLIKELIDGIDSDVVVSAMTNKAANVLRIKGIVDAVTAFKACLVPTYIEPGSELLKYLRAEKSTNAEEEITLRRYFDANELEAARNLIRNNGSLTDAMKMLEIDDFFHEYFLEWGPREEQDGVLIIDEASMLPEDLLSTIRESFSQIILVGDEHQLSPVKGEPVFWDSRVVQCMVRLTEVHRQAGASQPLQFADSIRAGKYIGMTPVVDIDVELCTQDIPIIVWTNDERKELTKKIRYKLGYIGSSPEVGEWLVCRENRDISGTEFVNNSMWKVVSTDGGDECVLADENGRKTKKPIPVHIEDYGTGYGLRCRYGYVLTCHNAQGSEFPAVMIHAQEAKRYLGCNRTEALKWLYTAVTRAKKKVIWVSSQIKDSR